MMSQAIPGPRSLRNSATRVVASTPGMHGGLLGMEQGSFEMLKGNVTLASIMINARGRPRRPEEPINIPEGVGEGIY
jgi:hypothetical protein